MANPQAENGHTDIANELMDAFSRTRISGEARQVLDVILRKTYGWHKKEDDIALSQFVEATGMSKSRVCQAITKLLSMNLISKKGNVTEKGNNWCSSYCFNKDFHTWKPLPKKETFLKKEKSITEKGKESFLKTGHTKENLTKETTKEKKRRAENLPEAIPFQEIVEDLNQKTGKSYKHTSKQTRSLIQARWNDGFRVEDFQRVHSNMSDKWLPDSKMQSYLRPETLYSPKFEGYLNDNPSQTEDEIENERRQLLAGS